MFKVDTSSPDNTLKVDTSTPDNTLKVDTSTPDNTLKVDISTPDNTRFCFHVRITFMVLMAGVVFNFGIHHVN
jgi:hypothetical protein